MLHTKPQINPYMRRILEMAVLYDEISCVYTGNVYCIVTPGPLRHINKKGQFVKTKWRTIQTLVNYGYLKFFLECPTDVTLEPTELSKEYVKKYDETHENVTSAFHSVSSAFHVTKRGVS